MDALLAESAIAPVASVSVAREERGGGAECLAPAPPPADAGRIRPMGSGAARRICSDQVVVDLRSALKELLENALDAGASKIEVRLRDHGVDALEVADNGAGIGQSDLDGVALRCVEGGSRRETPPPHPPPRIPLLTLSAPPYLSPPPPPPPPPPRHTTSKLKDFDDLDRLSSFGFRGEALNSLAALGKFYKKRRRVLSFLP